MADISKIKTPDGTEYNIKDTTARGLVVANPTLAGTESDLTGLQVNGTKYKVPSGGGGGTSLSFTVTLTAARWNSNSQTVSNANFVTSGYAYTVAPASPSFSDYASAQIYADDVIIDGSMTFHCASVPTGNLTVNVLRTEVSA